MSYTLKEEEGVVYSEPTTTCPLTGKGERTCYYNREIKPKLVDCDLRTESIYTIRGNIISRVDFTFSFEAPVLFSSVTFYYFCSTRFSFVAYIFLSTGSPGPVALFCERTNTLSQATYTLDTGEMQYQEIRLSVRNAGTQPADLYLSEVMFLDSETGIILSVIYLSCDHTYVPILISLHRQFLLRTQAQCEGVIPPCSSEPLPFTHSVCNIMCIE